MPAPLTTSAFAFAFVLILIGSDIGGWLVGTAGMVNQLLVEAAAYQASKEPTDGLG
jgi:hypothetical protein